LTPQSLGQLTAPSVPSNLEVVSVIPTMILFGLVTGYWWKLALPAAAVTWPTLLLASDTIAAGQIPAAALLGLVNAAVGVALVQGVLAAIRGFRHRASQGTRASRA
jgi:hypothetical protein